MRREEINPRLQKYFDALSNPIRFEIFREILDLSDDFDEDLPEKSKCYISGIAERLSIRQPTVSNHVKVLVEAGLVETKKITRTVYLFGTITMANDFLKFGQYFFAKDLEFKGNGEYCYLTTYKKNKAKHEVELCYAQEGEKIYLLSQVHRGGRITDWANNLLKSGKGKIKLRGKSFKITRVKSTLTKKDEKQIRRMFRKKYGKEHYNLWYKGTKRVPLILEI